MSVPDFAWLLPPALGTPTCLPPKPHAPEICLSSLHCPPPRNAQLSVIYRTLSREKEGDDSRTTHMAAFSGPGPCKSLQVGTPPARAPTPWQTGPRSWECLTVSTDPCLLSWGSSLKWPRSPALTFHLENSTKYYAESLLREPGHARPFTGTPCCGP